MVKRKKNILTMFLMLFCGGRNYICTGNALYWLHGAVGGCLQVVITSFDTGRFRVLVRRVNCVAQVHEERVTDPDR